MRISGLDFMRLSRATDLVVTDHALERMSQCGGIDATKALAASLFARGRQVTVDEMRLLGYRPGYGRRRRKGEKSWYFRFFLFGLEMVAVIAEGDRPGQVAWVTTYAPDRESELLRTSDLEALATA